MDSAAISTTVAIVTATVTALGTYAATRRRQRSRWDEAVLKEGAQIRQELYTRIQDFERRFDVIREQNAQFRANFLEMKLAHDECEGRLTNAMARLEKVEKKINGD